MTKLNLFILFFAKKIYFYFTAKVIIDTPFDVSFDYLRMVNYGLK